MIAVCDAYEAMISERPYSVAMCPSGRSRSCAAGPGHSSTRRSWPRSSASSPPAPPIPSATASRRSPRAAGTRPGKSPGGSTAVPDKPGMPHPLQLALSAQYYGDTMVMEKPPPWIQRLALAV